MRALWQKYGRDFYQKALDGQQQGLGEDEIEALIEQSTGVKTKRFMDKYVRGTDDLPLTQLYADFGVTLNDERKASKSSLGVRVVKDGADCKLANVHENRAAHKAGLSAGDILMALNGLRITAADAADGLAGALARYRVGETVLIHAFRRDELLTIEAKLQADDVPAFSLSLLEKSKAALVSARPSATRSKKSRKV
jgi:predicted metalloprotease with PDZ domain